MWWWRSCSIRITWVLHPAEVQWAWRIEHLVRIRVPGRLHAGDGGRRLAAAQGAAGELGRDGLAPLAAEPEAHEVVVVALHPDHHRLGGLAAGDVRGLVEAALDEARLGQLADVDGLAQHRSGARHGEGEEAAAVVLGDAAEHHPVPEHLRAVVGVAGLERRVELGLGGRLAGQLARGHQLPLLLAPAEHRGEPVGRRVAAVGVVALDLLAGVGAEDPLAPAAAREDQRGGPVVGRAEEAEPLLGRRDRRRQRRAAGPGRGPPHRAEEGGAGRALIVDEDAEVEPGVRLGVHGLEGERLLRERRAPAEGVGVERVGLRGRRGDLDGRRGGDVLERGQRPQLVDGAPRSPVNAAGSLSSLPSAAAAWARSLSPLVRPASRSPSSSWYASLPHPSGQRSPPSVVRCSSVRVIAVSWTRRRRVLGASPPRAARPGGSGRAPRRRGQSARPPCAPAGH